MDLPKNFKKKEYIEIWYSDLGRFFGEYFGCKFEMHGLLDHPSQNSYFTYEVPSYRDWEWEWNEEMKKQIDNPNKGDEIRAALKNGDTSEASMEALLDILHDNGVIPTGDYLVTVWW